MAYPLEIHMEFPDRFSDKARRYASARPLYPDELYEFAASVAPGRDRVWDCGTGSGQAAGGLAKFLLSYVQTWSATRRCMSSQGYLFFERAEAALAPFWGAPDEKRNIHMPLHVVAGRHVVE